MNAPALRIVPADARPYLDPSSPEMAEARREAAESPDLADQFRAELRKEHARHDAFIRFAGSLAGGIGRDFTRSTPAAILQRARDAIASRDAYAASPEGKARAALNEAGRKLEALNAAYAEAQAAFSRNPSTAFNAIHKADSAAFSVFSGLGEASYAAGSL